MVERKSLEIKSDYHHYTYKRKPYGSHLQTGETFLFIPNTGDCVHLGYVKNPYDPIPELKELLKKNKPENL